jgi:preprotein translocase subunit SecD
MQRNLMIRTVVIAATVLICLFGIIGFPTSVAQLKSNVAHRIHLGLDLQGGSHLVLDVQVQDAAKTTADHLIESLRDETRTRNIPIAGFDRNDPATPQETGDIQVNIHGVDPSKGLAFRNLIAESYPDWILTPVNTTDYRMNMKPTAVIDLRRNTVQQSIETIDRRVNALGVVEPTIQPYGDPATVSSILVELTDGARRFVFPAGRRGKLRRPGPSIRAARPAPRRRLSRVTY